MPTITDRSPAQRFYDGIAKEFDRKWKRYNECTYRLLRRLLDHLEGAPQRVLDVGCGTGNVLSILRQRFPSAALTGIDLSPAMLEIARQKVRNARLLRGGLEDAPNGTYDLVTAVSMFHYLSDPQRWLACAAGLLNKSGILLLIDWDGSAPLMRLRKKRLERIPHIAHVYTEDEMESLLRRWKAVARARQSCGGGWWSLQGFLATVSVNLPMSSTATQRNTI